MNDIPEDYYIKYPEQSNTGVEKERIEKEADAYATKATELIEKESGKILLKSYAKTDYIAGATAERERYIAALKELIPIAERNCTLVEMIAVNNAKRLTLKASKEV